MSAGALTGRDLDEAIRTKHNHIVRRLPCGRVVLDTGRVQIGLRAGERSSAREARGPSAALSADEELWQSHLLDDVERAGHRVLLLFSAVGAVIVCAALAAGLL